MVSLRSHFLLGLSDFGVMEETKVSVLGNSRDILLFFKNDSLTDSIDIWLEGAFFNLLDLLYASCPFKLVLCCFAKLDKSFFSRFSSWLILNGK
jgi:hypothetical protein